MASEGLEGPSKRRGNQGISLLGGAESGALDADLIEIINAWPLLGAAARVGVLAALRQALDKT